MTIIECCHVILSIGLLLRGISQDKGAGLNPDRVYPGGCDEEILAKIKHWINDPAANAPRLLWLSGANGTGKSTIAHTIAHWWIKENKGFGSCFCFDRRVETRCQDIFRAIARVHPGFQDALANIIAGDPLLGNTTNLAKQWQRLILEPISAFAGGLTQTVVIVIDALDESGDEMTRQRILPILAFDTLDLPPNFRILVTSQPLPDIFKAFGASKRLNLTSAYCAGTGPPPFRA